MANRPLGPRVENWTPRPLPQDIHLVGDRAIVVPLTTDHADDLYAAFEGNDWVFDYLYEAPFADVEAYRDWVATVIQRRDPYFVALCSPGGRPFGAAAFMRMDPANGAVEVGNINITPRGQKTTAVTEALFLMMSWAFDNGYRRFEWKCNALNAPSRRAAQRFGFSFEGVFRKHLIVKGRNRDTSWFAMTEDDWPALRSAYKTWLSPDNFDANGRQVQRLTDLTRPSLVTIDPSL